MTGRIVLFAMAVLVAGCEQEAEADAKSSHQPIELPAGVGQLESPPALFKGGTDEKGREFFLNGQPAKSGMLVFTASNGFFTSGVCKADGNSSLPSLDDGGLIGANFEYLKNWKGTDGTIRWHVWLAKPGAVRFNVKMRVAPSEAGSSLRFTFAGQSMDVKTVSAEPGKPQPWNLVFDAAKAGEHTFAASILKVADSNPATGVGELHRVDVYGPAVEGAQLLRARWRPAAVHGGYACSKLKTSRMWVMATRSLCDFSSYSPITTPFGYYGTSFTADRRSNGGFNFSMWAAGKGGKVPPLEQMPHLLAAGSPDAEFGGFGHEGSGVKIRGSWLPMPDKPEVCVQALRVENEGNYHTYHGYFWDHPTKAWKLYAVGRKWGGGKPIQHLYPGSFCEVPGPPNVQRSGDQVREVRRRGWFIGNDGQWKAMDKFDLRGAKGTMNKFWSISDEGEFAMGTGGMRFYNPEEPTPLEANTTLPEYLSPEATKQLYRLPAEFAGVKTVRTTNTEAELDISMLRAGMNARAEVYFGKTDCLTFAKRSLHGTERGSAVSQSTQAEDRSWSSKVGIETLKDGSNQVSIKGLVPGSTYFYRVLVTNSEGKLWTFSTGSFRTSNE